MTNRPWKNCQDITDYFNYGFNEQTFKHYARKVRETAKHLDKQLTDPESKFKDQLHNEQNAHQLKDNLPLEYGGLSQTCLPETHKLYSIVRPP